MGWGGVEGREGQGKGKSEEDDGEIAPLHAWWNFAV